MKELKCFKSFNNYFPSSYFTESLSSDIKALGLNGESLKDIKKTIEKDLLSLAEEMRTLDTRNNIRKSIAEKIYKCLGYYKISNAPKYEKERELTIKSNKVLVPIEKMISFLGEGELWLLTHYPEQGFQQLDELQDSDAENKAEFMFDEPTPTVLRNKPSAETLKDVIEAIFDGDQTDCESLIICSGDKLYLLERGKWQEGPHSYVELNLIDLFININDNSYYTMAETLFSPKSFPITTAENFHEELARNSHKKAAEVTKALRDTVRQSIEILADEILRQHAAKPLTIWKSKDFKNLKDRNECAQELFDQTLKYIYRMLFMFFTESKEQAKGSLPVHSKAYQKGYSIEKLRDLELKTFLASETENSQSHFIQDTLNRAFKIYYNGYNNNTDRTKTDALGFSFPSLGTHLFNPESTPIYSEVSLPDSILQKVIQKMSLAKTGTGKGTKQHRVHYAGLGLNQLGAVYEGLLTLKPEILSEKVVLLAKENKDAAHRYIPFTQKSKILEKNLATDERDNIITKEKGSFILTPVGLERKFSASFYTPEVLTRFLAKESVQTLLGDNPTLEKMENLKILEPAMGSGAFLNAVVDEIAPKMAKLYEAPVRKAYEAAIQKLEKQGKANNSLELEKIKELKPKALNYYIAKAKKHLMVHAVHGVDLNPTAVELAKISLWLNCLHDDGNLPFLDMKLRLGNSLVGAWVNRHQDEKTELPHWFLPNPIAIDPHLDGNILGDKKRPFIADKKEIDRLKNIQSDWTQLKNDSEAINELNQIHKDVQKLYQTYLKLKKEYQNKIRGLDNPIEKENIFKQYINENKAYNQLRTMMDYWCSLWFWPHTELKHLPSKNDFIKALNWIAKNPISYGQNQKGELESSKIKSLAISRQIALDMKFFHYDLEFADIFDQGGFDLCLGNPPWAKVQWEEIDYYNELDLDNTETRDKLQKKLSNIITKDSIIKNDYLDKKIKVFSYGNFLKFSGTYPHIDNSKSNTYKYFFQRFSSATKPNGVYAIICQEGIIKDPDNTELSNSCLKDLDFLYRFHNYFNLFTDVPSDVDFIVMVLRKKASFNPKFKLMDKVLSPLTIEKSRRESTNSLYPGLKDSQGKWNLQGHPKRIIELDLNVLNSLKNFNLSQNNYVLPWIYGEPEMNVMISLANQKHKINLSNVSCSFGIDQTKALLAGDIKTSQKENEKTEDIIITGPNIFPSNPFYKTADTPCTKKSDYSNVNLKAIDEDFFIKGRFYLTEKGKQLSTLKQLTPWQTNHFESFKLIGRKRINTESERSYSVALYPKGSLHTGNQFSLVFKNYLETAINGAIHSSIIFDFLIKNLSGGSITENTLECLPMMDIVENKILIKKLCTTFVRLNCLTRHYKNFIDGIIIDGSERDIKFEKEILYSSIRENNERESALVEIDVITSLIFDISKIDLLNIYRSQFGRMQIALQDLPNQNVDSEKYHFPRFQAMSDAYDQFASLVGKKAKVLDLRTKTKNENKTADKKKTRRA